MRVFLSAVICAHAGQGQPFGVGVAVSKGGGDLGPRKGKHSVWYVGCCGDVAFELATSALRWRGVFGYMPAEGGRCMQAGELQAGATA